MSNWSKMHNKHYTATIAPITQDQEKEVWELIGKFNELNAPKKGSRSCVQITAFAKYHKMQQNGARFALAFKENFHGEEKFSRFEFVSAEKLLNYLHQHT